MRWQCVTAACVAATLTGCGGSKYQPVAGTVTMGGAPVGGATVTFIPDGKGGADGTATTGPDGKYTAATRQGDKGLPAGSYKVVVSKKPTPPTDGGAYDPATLKEELPATYSDAKTTTLTANVDSSGKPIDFTLDKKK